MKRLTESTTKNKKEKTISFKAVRTIIDDLEEEVNQLADPFIQLQRDISKVFKKHRDKYKQPYKRRKQK